MSSGVVAKDDIKRNTLLVASKAVSISYRAELTDSQRFYLDDTRFKFEHKPQQVQNHAQLVQRVQNDPYLARQVYKLYAGPDFSRDEAEVSKLCEEGTIDSDRLYAIAHYNSLTSAYDDDTEPESEHDPLNHENEGLWLQPAYFNHSCLPNTRTHFFADFMMIYTSKCIVFLLTFFFSTFCI